MACAAGSLSLPCKPVDGTAAAGRCLLLVLHAAACQQRRQQRRCRGVQPHKCLGCGGGRAQACGCHAELLCSRPQQRVAAGQQRRQGLQQLRLPLLWVRRPVPLRRRGARVPPRAAVLRQRRRQLCSGVLQLL